MNYGLSIRTGFGPHEVFILMPTCLVWPASGCSTVKYYIGLNCPSRPETFIYLPDHAEHELGTHKVETIFFQNGTFHATQEKFSIVTEKSYFWF
jgi:hypothetical protein